MSRKRRKGFEHYQDFIARLYPQDHPADDELVLTRSATFQVTDACNLACKYCYQINKGVRRMPLDVAKKFVDLLLTGEKGMSDYLSVDTSPAIILDFIGGEPLLEVELIGQIVDYFQERAIELNHPWADNFIISICSNGVLYFDEKVQEFFSKRKYRTSFNVTIDGNRELHDSCRIFPDGSPSYDLAVAAVKDWVAQGGYMGSKITIAPENLEYLTDALQHMLDLGYAEINANTVFEEGWTQEHAKRFYVKLKEAADVLLKDENLDVYCSLFEERFFKPKEIDDVQNWCGGNGAMISCDPDGYIYPCIRWMESSLGSDQPAVRIGDVWNGMGSCGGCEYQKCLECVCGIDRRTQSTDDCYYCPLAEGCAWCQAYNYQFSGNFHTRATFSCEMHKARALANVYFWNKYYEKINSREWFKCWVPEEWALQIIDEAEYRMLLALESEQQQRAIVCSNNVDSKTFDACSKQWSDRLTLNRG